MSRALQLQIASVIALVGMVAGRPAEAQWLTDNGTVVFDTGYESDTVGQKPAILPVGTYNAVVARNNGTLNVLGPSSTGPGAAPGLGNNYLSGTRPGSQDDTYFLGTPSQTVNTGDALSLDAWVNVPSAVDFQFCMGFQSSDLSTFLFAEAISTPGSAPNTFRIQLGQGNEGADLTDITYTPNVWQEWKLDWVVGSSQATLTVAGVSETRMNLDPGDLPGDTGGAISAIRVFSSNFPAQYYVDAAQYRGGDVNHDNVVNGLDISLISSHWLQTGTVGSLPGDANNDGVVNGLDIALAASQWLKTTTVGTYQTPPPPGASVPEPGTLTLAAFSLVIAGVYVRRRRRAK
jgi:hypothetical protein